MSQRPVVMIAPPLERYKVIIGQHLRAVRFRKCSVTLKFDGADLKRTIEGGEYIKTPGADLDWVKMFDGLTIRQVDEYETGIVLDFGLKGIYFADNGEVRPVDRKPSSEASQ